MLPLTGTMTLVEISAEPGLVVFMRGCISGSTVGRVSGIDSYLRTNHKVSEVSEWSRELAVLGYNADQPFSAKGDSGSAIFAKDGRLVGMLTGGYDKAIGGRYDISYLTPWSAQAKQMTAFGLMDPQPILVSHLTAESS